MIGSFGKTSRPAPATLPVSSAFPSASRSSSSPRAQLMILTPSFIWANASASSEVLVSGVFGR